MLIRHAGEALIQQLRARRRRMLASDSVVDRLSAVQLLGGQNRKQTGECWVGLALGGIRPCDKSAYPTGCTRSSGPLRQTFLRPDPAKSARSPLSLSPRFRGGGLGGGQSLDRRFLGGSS